jgi:CubicO group peptidase (beta-lactamase class C family)
MSDKFQNTCLKFRLVAVFMLILQTAFSQGHFAALDQFINENKKQLGTEFSVVVAVADTIPFQKTVGDAQPKTPVPIGASSQWLTTALILQLADEGKLSLDDKVSQYLPVFESYRKGYITIRHCLSNQTGIGNNGFKLAALFEKSKYNSLEEEIPDIAKKEIHANAGEQFRYTNYGYLIAARIAEIVTKKRFDQVIRSRLFVPLGMRNTTFTTDDGSAPNAANGAKSTALDYAKFLQMLLNGGKAGAKQILSGAAIEELRKVQIDQDHIKQVPKGTENFSFALGSWEVEGAHTKGALASALALPGWNGTWPLIDFNRGYALIVLPKSFSGEQLTTPYLSLKSIADQQGWKSK